MQFIPRGPNVPDNLLFAHEKGEVVFFCGAGISMRKPVKLPNFEGLVKILFKEYGHEFKKRNSMQEQLLTRLENTIPGGREAIIKHVYNILNPSRLSQVTSPIHQALLTLARQSDATMLVTTNFDRLFEQCLQGNKNKQPAIIAPRLPIPKPNHWHKGGVVYLHGLIPEDPRNDVHRDNLILTSGDFGRAYLSERWAARFVTELFRNYVVCFVGYSLNDPVMRYLSDALADDRKDGIRLPERYIFLSKKEVKNTSKKDYHGLHIIHYDDAENHRLLHETFTAWAKDYRDENTKKQVIQKFINSNNSDLSRITEFRADPDIDRFMWALHDKDAAKYFAEMHPLPAWEIINVLDAKETDKSDNFQKFSLLEPMIKSEYKTYRNISDLGIYSVASPVYYFYKWIARHADKPEIASWVAQKGGILNAEFKKIILCELAKKRGTKEYPDPSISSVMHEVWQLILSDDISNLNLYDTTEWHLQLSAWIERHKQAGLTSSLKRQLEHIIQPKFKLSPKAEEAGDAQHIKDIFQIEIDFVSDYRFDELKEIALSEETPDDDKLFYIQLFYSLLCKIFTLADKTCGDERYFTAFLDNNLDKILYGEQERFHDVRYHLLDAMPKLLSQITEKDQEKAKAIVMEWLDSHYILINRIGLHCLHESSLIDSESIAKAILNNDAKLLKDRCANSQIIPLLREHAAQFSENSCHRIQTALLAIEDNARYDYLIIDYLNTLQDGGINLLEDANARLEELKKKRGYPDNVSPPKPAPPPSIEDDIQTWAQYLEDPPKDQNDPYQQNLSRAWNNFCETDPLKAFKALKALNIEKGQSDQYWPWHSFFGKIGPIVRKQVEALSNKGSDDSRKEKLKHLDIVAIIGYWLDSMEESNQLKFLSSILDVVESSLRLLKSSDEGNALLNRCMKHIMALLMLHPKHDFDDELNKQDILTAAINNPIGKFAELVMQHQILTSPQYSEGLLSITKEFFEEILSIKQSDVSRYGLCVIARRLIYLFSYDKEWATEKLIPCFSWNDTTKARAAWSGYLWHAHWTPDLIKSLDNDLLATIDHIDDLDKDCKDAFAHLIGSLALYKKTDILSVANLRECVEKFDEDLCRALLEKVKSSLESTETNDRDTFWKNLIEPFFKQIWPNDVDKLNARMSYIFGDIILMEGNAFPDAVEQLAYQWAEAIKKTPDYLIGFFRFVLEHLKNREHAKNHPQATIDLLYVILDREIILDERDEEIWEQHILVYLESRNNKRLEIIKKKLK